MIVMGSDGICHVAQHVRQMLLSSALDPYLASDLRFTAMSLDLIAEDYDRAVDVLVLDRTEVADIFSTALPHFDGDLRDQVERRLESTPKNLRVRTLTDVADDDMRVMIDLHQATELVAVTGKTWAVELNQKIWRFIENYADRRIYRSPI